MRLALRTVSCIQLELLNHCPLHSQNKQIVNFATKT